MTSKGRVGLQAKRHPGAEFKLRAVRWPMIAAISVLGVAQNKFWNPLLMRPGVGGDVILTLCSAKTTSQHPFCF